MRGCLKRIAARLPRKFQQSLKRIYFAKQIRSHSFCADEPEFDLAADLLAAGDWAIDVGANIGHYTLRFSSLVGPKGRVLAFEPVPDSFAILCSNVSVINAQNVTLINAAASNQTATAGIEIPKLDSGLENYYMAHLAEAEDGLTVLCFSIDSLSLPDKIRLVKIDAEGHDFQVLQGMQELIRRDRPIVFIEECTSDVVAFFADLGYSKQTLHGSPNSIFRPS